jgi:ankyrin repeat protein
MYVKEYSM